MKLKLLLSWCNSLRKADQQQKKQRVSNKEYINYFCQISRGTCIETADCGFQSSLSLSNSKQRRIRVDHTVTSTWANNRGGGTHIAIKPHDDCQYRTTRGRRGWEAASSFPPGVPRRQTGGYNKVQTKLGVLKKEYRVNLLPLIVWGG